jgi:DNA sulfur modification protein DndB
MQSELNEENLRLFQQSIEPYFAEHHKEKCYPGLVLQQGHRKMVQINVPADHLLTLLQSKPSTDNDPDSGKNRNEEKNHVKVIKEYVLKCAKNNKPWILGTLTANVDPSEITIIELGRGICIVIIKRGSKLDITDGQHRKRAIEELMLSADSHVVSEHDFPITLVLEDNFSQCQTDFRDMAQTRPLDKSLLLSFGEFEGKVGITKNIIKNVSMFNAKTELIKKSPPKNSKFIFTMNYLAQFVSNSFTNYPGNDLEDYDVAGASFVLTECLNTFFSNCADTEYISNSPLESITIEDVHNFKNSCILVKSVGLQSLGKLLYTTYDSENNVFDRDRVMELTKVDWSKNSPMWIGNIDIGSNATAESKAIMAVKNYLDWN